MFTVIGYTPKGVPYRVQVNAGKATGSPHGLAIIDAARGHTAAVTPTGPFIDVPAAAAGGDPDVLAAPDTAILAALHAGSRVTSVTGDPPSLDVELPSGSIG